MKNGFLFPVFDILLRAIKYLNLVELFKCVAAKIARRRKADQQRTISSQRLAVDVFVVLKWLFVGIAWHLGAGGTVFVILTWYLIITNLSTYFTYHLWQGEPLGEVDSDLTRVKRRVILLLSSIGFSDFCFAYLFKIPYHQELSWGTPATLQDLRALLFSFSNSLAANYETVKPVTDLGNLVAMIQLAVTFVFVAVLLSNSLPGAIQAPSRPTPGKQVRT